MTAQKDFFPHIIDRCIGISPLSGTIGGGCSKFYIEDIILWQTGKRVFYSLAHRAVFINRFLLCLVY